MTTAAEWVIYTGIVAVAVVLGVIIGQLVQWRVRRGLHVPGWAHVSLTRRTGALLLSVLAILTVLSSMLTSYELQRTDQRGADAAAEQRECTQSLVERVAVRTEIADADHQNTTMFVQKLRDALAADGLSGPAIIRAADLYLEEQDRLEADRAETPIWEHACR